MNGADYTKQQSNMKGYFMKPKSGICSLLFTVFIFFTPVSLPGADPNNGFPSGPHFNLNIHGKAATLYCSSHIAEWVFNITDFVEMFYGISNSGLKLVQVRFYPRIKEHVK